MSDVLDSPNPTLVGRELKGVQVTRFAGTRLKRRISGVAAVSTITALTLLAPTTVIAGAAAKPASPMATTLAYLRHGLPNLHGKTVAYLAECVTENTYCQARLRGAQQMARKSHVKLTVYDAGFSTSTQLSQVQDAIQKGFDGYVFSPVASATGCADFKLLEATKRPIATINSPMCGNPGYTPGTVGFVGMQTQQFFTEHVENAFKSCKGNCEAVAVGGYVGSDLFTRWENAIKAAQVKYPNVTVVSNQPGNFTASDAFTVVQDALTSHPNVSIVVSSWDDMTRGVASAITASGKIPGKDVRIYSVGGTSYGVQQVKKGAWNETSVLLPIEESAYGFVQLFRDMATGKATPGMTFLAQAPAVTKGPGSIFITRSNASKFHPEY